MLQVYWSSPQFRFFCSNSGWQVKGKSIIYPTTAKVRLNKLRNGNETWLNLGQPELNLCPTALCKPLVEGWRERRTQYTSCKGITFSFVHYNHISLLQGVRGQFVFEVEYFIFRIVFQAEGRLHYKPWCIGRRMIMQIIVTVLSSSQNLLADMMLEAAAAAPRSENTPLATPLSDEDTCFYHRPLDSDYRAL